MDYTSYLIPESVKESCRDYISRLQKENKVYEDVKSRVNAFLIDESSQGEAITALKDRVSNYSAILATLILANEYDINDSYKFMNLVGDEIFDGSVILQAKQDAYDDWVEYGNNASDFRGKEKRATTQDEADSYRGQADNWDRMASEAKGSYDHFCKKEEKFDEIEEACSSLFLSSKELRENANNLLKFINSGTDLKANAEDYAKYRQDLTAGYYGSDRTYGGNTVSSSNGQKVDFSMFWKDNHDSNMSNDEKEGVLEELKAKKAAYQKALEETDDPHQKDFLQGLIAETNKSIEKLKKQKQESDSIEPLPGEEKEFVKTTYTSQKIAALYEEKAAIERAIEMVPDQQKAYLMSKLEILEKNIQSWVDYGLDNANHDEEFRFVYDRMSESDYSEEEILKVISYWMYVDDESNLQGKEMPKWWMDEYLTIPDELKVNEENVTTIYKDEIMKQKLEDFYFSSYFLVDCISGRGYKQYANYDENGNWTREENLNYDAKGLREEYLNNLYDEYENNKLVKKLDPNVSYGMMLSWYDALYGPMEEYVKGESTVRASKYALENHLNFPDLKDEYGVYNIYDKEENGYYRFCKNAYLYKYDHAEEYFNTFINTEHFWDYLQTSDSSDERFFYYLQTDIDNSILKEFTTSEQILLKENYKAHKNGELMYSKNFFDIVNQLQDDQSIFAQGDYKVEIDGKKIIITATIIDGMDYLTNSHSDCYVLDFSDCCYSAFGSFYVNNKAFSDKMFEYSKYKYENGWIDPEYTSSREVDIEKIMQSDEVDILLSEYIVNYDSLSENEKIAYKEEYRKNLYITADCQSELFCIYDNDRGTKIDKTNEAWNQYMRGLAMLSACSIMFLPGGFITASMAALSYANGLKQCAQGNYFEGGTQIAVTTAFILTPTIVNKINNAQAVKACKEAQELAKYGDKLDDLNFRVLDENFENLEYIETNPISNEKLNGLKGYNKVNVTVEGAGNKIGNFSNLEGSTVEEILERIPNDAQLRELKPVDGGSTEGFEFKWSSEGKTYRVRVHNQDPSAPKGSNANNGWVVRVQRGGQYFDPKINDFREAKYFNPRGPFFDETICNDTHIPIKEP